MKWNKEKMSILDHSVLSVKGTQYRCISSSCVWRNSNVKDWIVICRGEKGPWISHLMLADDLLIREATQSQMECVMTIHI